MKPRIEPIPDDKATPAAQALLEQTRRSIGKIPNLHRTLAHAPAALEGYLETGRALAGGVLDRKLREQIAVASAGVNGCAYCASAHTMIGKMVGVDEAELARNLGAESADPRAAAALAFTRRLIETRGAVSDAELDALRGAGFSDAEIVEIVAHVGMNFFTNTFNVLAETTIDFPEVRLAASC